MEKRNTIIAMSIVCFILFCIFSLQIYIFSNSRTNKNNNLKLKNSTTNSLDNYSKQNHSTKDIIISDKNSEKINLVKTFPQSLYENKNNLKNIKNQMEIVNRKVRYMRRLRENQ